MRYLAGVLFLASCTLLTPVSIDDRVAEQPTPVDNSVANPDVNPESSESRTEARKQKLRPASPSISEVSSCANLDAGDLKETIKAKLDCIKEHAR